MMTKTTWRLALENQSRLLTEQALQEGKHAVIRVIVVNANKRLTEVCSDSELMAWVSLVLRVVKPKVADSDTVGGDPWR